MDNSMEVPQKIKKRVIIKSSNLTPRHMSRDNCNSKRYLHSYVLSSTIYNSQDMETTQVPINRWMDKEDVVYVYNEILKWPESHSVVSDSLWPHGLQPVRLREWIATSFSRRSSRPRDWTRVSCIVGRRFTIWATREADTNNFINETDSENKPEVAKGKRESGRDGLGVWDLQMQTIT